MAIAGDQSSIKSLFTAEVNYFTITGEDQSIIDRHECSHVKVERHHEHKIVVLNQITEEETTEVMKLYCCQIILRVVGLLNRGLNVVSGSTTRGLN